MTTRLTLLLILLAVSLNAAALNIEITRGAEGALPIAVVPFGWSGPGTPPAEDIASIIRDDLTHSGRFRVMPVKDMLAQPHNDSEVEFRDWKALNMDYLVIGQVTANGEGGYLIRFQLFDVFKGEQLTGYEIPSTAQNLRSRAHQTADYIYEKLTGQRGAFDTRVAYVTSTRKAGGDQQVMLKMADADGINPVTLVTSSDPLMSPAW
ncbi:MAG: Tol-Pal system protein TolB, partial [Candidatus Sedimenticola sp. (ex Thyasira tokunagai)]